MKSNYIPFYYELKFSLISYNNNDDLKRNSKTLKFQSENPLNSRFEAFTEFEEFLSYLIPHGRVEKVNGNYVITQPTFIHDLIKKKEEQFHDEWNEKFKNFKQEITIHLIISDKELATNIQKNPEIDKYFEGLNLPEIVEMDFLIHKVGSEVNVHEEQEMADNLELIELKLYEYLKIDITNYKKNIQHFGLDYFDSGEEENGCERTIIETPHVWSSKERYEIEFLKDDEIHRNNENSKVLNWEYVIDQGEGNLIEFKPALRYHFEKRKEDNIVRYINAKVICSFLNSNGGILFIGIDDNANIQGLDGDFSLFDGNFHDKFKNEFDNLLYYFLPPFVKPFVNLKIESVKGKEIGIIMVEKCKQPVFLKNRKTGEIQKEFFMRGEASTRQISDIEEIIQYVFNNWRNF
jgi:uncharacterized protein YkvS